MVEPTVTPLAYDLELRYQRMKLKAPANIESVSSGRLALKGESSRHFQHVKEVRTDCDRDVVLFKVVQDVAACHEGYRSCFFREVTPAGGRSRAVSRGCGSCCARAGAASARHSRASLMASRAAAMTATSRRILSRTSSGVVRRRTRSARNFGACMRQTVMTTAAALRYAKIGDYRKHREWVIRSFAMIFAAPTLRIWLGSLTAWLLGTAAAISVKASAMRFSGVDGLGRRARMGSPWI